MEEKTDERRDCGESATGDRSTEPMFPLLSFFSTFAPTLSLDLFQPLLLLTWSASLSGWPSLTDSEVKRKVSSSAICFWV